jgi:anti-sigma factor RsiW
VAYNLDYLEPTILVSPSPLDAVRSVRIAGLVAGSSQQAWLFSAPSQAEAARFAFGGEQGPGGYSESEFLAYLDARGVSARVVHAGILDAVLPATPVDLPTLTSEKGDSRFRSVLALQR